MKKYDELWNNINNLLALLESGSHPPGSAVNLTKEYYFGKFGNSAPHQLLQMEIDKLQKKLDEAE